METRYLTPALFAVTAILLLIGLMGCEENVVTPDTEAKTEALRTLREADKAWSQSAPDLDAFMSFITGDVIWITPDGTLKSGKNEVRSYLEGVFALPSFSLTFTPDGIDVSDAGDMGYVYGLYKWSYLTSSGNLVEYTNRSYVTFWKKQSSGGWKVVLEADY